MKCIKNEEFIYRVGDKLAYDMIEQDHCEFVPKQVWKDAQPDGHDGVNKPRLNKVRIS